MIDTLIRTATAASLLALAACGDIGISTATSAGGLAGSWELTSVDGCAIGSTGCTNRSFIVGGSLQLGLRGEATRTIRYRTDGDTAPRTLVQSGTATMPNDRVVELRLFEGAGGGPIHYRGEIDGPRMTIRYPHPADGEAVEVWTWRTVLN